MKKPMSTLAAAGIGAASGWTVLNAPDRYPNVAFRCFGPNGIYAPRNADNAAARNFQVVPNDANCPQR